MIKHPLFHLAAAFTLLIALFISPVNSAQAAPPRAAIGGCPMFPADNVWNAPVDTLPLDSNSSAYVNTINAGGNFLHADFGSGLWDGGPIGIPFITVPGNQAKVGITFDYWDESDPGPYPIPPDAPIEGGPNSNGDRHILIVETGSCTLYEVYAAYPNGDGTWRAGSGAVWNLNSDALRPAGATSADAAGLPIVPGLVTYDEVASGVINHAIRFTAPQTRRAYVWPARHLASSLTGAQYPPMGERFRLKAGYDISGFSPEVQVILTAMKKYGIFLADNGSSWYISGAPDERWNNDALRQLQSVPGSAFEAVDESSLMVDSNSGQAGTGGGGGGGGGGTPTTVDDTATSITYTGSWKIQSDSSTYGGKYHVSSKSNAWAAFNFTGAQFTLILGRGPKFGRLDVIVDGTRVTTLDLYNSSKQWQYHVPITGLSNGPHTVQLHILGTRSSSSGGNKVVFDGYSVP